MNLFNLKTNNLSNIKEKSCDKDFYSGTFHTNIGDYELNIILKQDKLILKCESLIEFMSLFTYSKEISYEELKNLCVSFKSCDNIEQIFTVIKNLLKGVTININDNIFNNDDKYESNLMINFSDKDSLIMKMKIPLLYQEYENIEIIFEKKQKNIIEQYEKLRDKYLKVKDLISNHRCSDNYYNKKELSLGEQLKIIEEGDITQ